MLTPHSLHRVANALYRRKLFFLAHLVQGTIFLVFNAVLPANISIGRRTVYAHGGVGVVLHPATILGDHVLIGSGVTIGSRSRMSRAPVIEDDVYIGAGAKILGDITIGHHSIVGANAVVLSTIPPHSVVVGVPARIVKTGVDPEGIESW